MAGRRSVVALLLFLGSGVKPLSAAPPTEFPDIQSLEATRKRPLFSPTRRPPPPAVVEDDPAPDTPIIAPPPNIQVSGIIIGGDRRVAIVKGRKDGTAIPASVGDKIDGWIISAIDQRSIVLRLGSRSVSITMPDPGR